MFSVLRIKWLGSARFTQTGKPEAGRAPTSRPRDERSPARIMLHEGGSTCGRYATGKFFANDRKGHIFVVVNPSIATRRA